MDLALKYGDCIDPGKDLRDAERARQTSSKFMLDEDGSKGLKHLMALVETGFKLPSCLFDDFSLLWLVAEDGRIVLGLEEGFWEDTQFPLPKAMNRQLQKIGHPSLVDCQPARIGGELVYDPAGDGVKWTITNKSGRFGVNLDRKPEHLEAVANDFRLRGIEVQTLFM